jgi:cellulose synthase/poly-beta-1,6-N-acetylglucosamine synthase-like glycosyltransferase
MIESEVYASSIVVAPCYGFKRELLNAFPEDCVADDIYISFLANTMGKKTKYIREAVARELRAANRIRDFTVHKFRKGNAYVTEILRFLHSLPQMCGLWKLIYLTKFIQVVVVPWVVPLFILTSASLMLSGAGPLKIVVSAFAFLGLSFLFTHILVTSGRKKEKARYIPITYLQLFFITNLILIVVGLTYPFYKSSSEYYKIDEG